MNKISYLALNLLLLPVGKELNRGTFGSTGLDF